MEVAVALDRRQRQQIGIVCLLGWLVGVHVPFTHVLFLQVIIPDFQWFRQEIEELFDEIDTIDSGSVSTLIPELAVVDRGKFAVSVTTVDGQRFSVGDAKSLVSP